MAKLSFSFLLLFATSLQLLEGTIDKSWLKKPYGEQVFLKPPPTTPMPQTIPEASVLLEDPKPEAAIRIKVVPLRGVEGRGTTAKPSVVTNEEDKKVRKDWGGNCTNYHWQLCIRKSTFGNDVFDPETNKKIAWQMDCTDIDEFPPVCLYNGWTVTRCHLLCMSRQCNRDITIYYEDFVKKDGFC